MISTEYWSHQFKNKTTKVSNSNHFISTFPIKIVISEAWFMDKKTQMEGFKNFKIK